ncbi:DUF3375 family protein [Fodinicola acaciae]|uniref:DUF3375 family protein n=1 Tax=Fodinicola acaciae TaxID=2681555 RepID=UPI0013D1C49B|nr:DUF3375 family protein [Fodinicola acaciae]
MAAGVTPSEIKSALFGNATLRLLSARSRDWVLPLFAEHLEAVDESVSAEWFHERIAEALENNPDWHGDRSPAEHCRRWVEARWLETEIEAGRLRYRLSPYSLRALRIVREIVEGESSVSGARLGSIAHAVRLLADMTNPDREIQVRRIDAQIAELRNRRKEIATGRARLATVEEMRQQLREILAMTRSLPADFRQLRTLVEDRHQKVARRAMADGPSKADLVEEYLQENDLLARTPEGIAYQGFSRMLASSQQARSISEDIEQILAQDFAGDHMTVAQREQLETMLSTLMRAELAVEQVYLRWTASLRRFLTRSAHARHRRLVTLAERALHAGAEWVERSPGARSIDDDVLGIGRIAVADISQTQLWRDLGPQRVIVEAVPQATVLPETDRAALRLAAGTSRRVMARTVNTLLRGRHIVTAAEVFAATPTEFQRLGAVVSLLDLAIDHGHVRLDVREYVALAGDREQALRVVLPHLIFDRPIEGGEAS